MSAPGFAYVIVNAGASATAFGISVVLQWRFGVSQQGSQEALTVVRVAVAGFGAMAVLRSSLFTLTQGEAKIEAGPAYLLTALRMAIDRAFDQRQAEAAINSSELLLSGLKFARDHEALTLLCSGSLVNPDPKSAEELGRLAADLKATEMDDELKLQVYALRLFELAGRGPVEAAARRMRSRRTDASTSGGLPTQLDREAWRCTAWRIAKAADELLAVTEDEYLRVDLELLRASKLWSVDPVLGALAFSEVHFQPAVLLFGSPTVLSRSASHVARQLLLLLTPPKEPDPRAKAPSPLEEAQRRGRPPFRLASWVYAAALYEMWRYVHDSTLALDVLNASIDYRALWDVHVARASVHLSAGNEQGAAHDLDIALGGALPHADRVYREPQVVAREDFSPILRPLRALLEPGLPLAARPALWDSAVERWTNAARQSRPGATPRQEFTAVGSRRLKGDNQLMNTSALLRAVALDIPHRLPHELRERDFDPRPGEEAVGQELVARLANLFVAANEKRSSSMLIGPSLEDRDATLPILPKLSAVLRGSLDDWLQRGHAAPTGTMVTAGVPEVERT